MSFEEKLKEGLLGEGEISKWFISRGYSVLPAYEVELNHGKGPRLFTKEGTLISPDLLVFNASRILWIEAKTKSAFTWHRLSRTWQTGIDRKHWGHYLCVAARTPFPVGILFLHKPNCTAKDTPEGMVSPSGLFGNNIASLKDSVHHTSCLHGPSGMVYWTLGNLKKIAEYNDVCRK
jgi:hypothetical protein